MIARIFKTFSGRHYRGYIKKLQPVIAQINRLEESYQGLSDDAIRGKTAEFRQRLAEGTSLDDLLPEAYAVVKNTARRLCGKPVTVCGHELPWDMVHFDVQLIGGIALHQHYIAEMSTGEGKTLVATLPLYLNALTGRNVQLVTTNDYLARRDSEWMGYIYKFLGLTVGCIQNQMRPEERKQAYGCDITYGTASEFGFDYLRDNGMATRADDQVQRDHYFVIVDEVDQILVDEARTPLIISGPAPIEREQQFTRHKPIISRLVQEQTRMCNRLITEAKEELEKEDGDQRIAALKMLQVKLGAPKNKQLLRLMESGEYRKLLDKIDLEMNSDVNKTIMFQLKEELYFLIDEKQHQADLTEKGRTFLQPDDPDGFMMPDLPSQFIDIEKNPQLTPEQKEAEKAKAQDAFEKVSEDIHAISQLLRAYSLYERDVRYVVQDGKVMIVDENTGRIMPGRRWSDGLHQAVEAKEGVTIERETRTYATITIQNYFRLYDKLAGMTGTAETEANEFFDIYKMKVMVIPTHKPCIRIDNNDVIYKTRREKYASVLEQIQEAHKKGQPVLVGTVSVEASELLSRMLRRVNIAHNVLNAKFHEQEAEIIARAGIRGGVTIATNMAGRGTDIKLGEGVAELGGLFVIGTERHESRRIDRQLRGRCARQGDPGQSKFFISLEDDLMRLFASAGPMGRIMEKAMGEGEELQHPLLNRSIESAQKKVEQQNYSIRKRLLQYDDVLSQQREVIYGLRNEAIRGEAPKEVIFEMIEEELAARLDDVGFDVKQGVPAAQLEGFLGWLNAHFPVGVKMPEVEGKSREEVSAVVLTRIQEAYKIKESVENPEALKMLERYVIISPIDRQWQEHLTEMEELRRSIGLRGYGQKDPLMEYKGEAFTFFQELMENVRRDICVGLFRSATHITAFENMLARLAQNARAQGPADQPATQASNIGNPAAVRQVATAGAAIAGGRKEVELPKVSVQREMAKVGRNDPCPCGSGKKYKKCCGVD
jgi:preprotein translocase subunit SecA